MKLKKEREIKKKEKKKEVSSEKEVPKKTEKVMGASFFSGTATAAADTSYPAIPSYIPPPDSTSFGGGGFEYVNSLFFPHLLVPLLTFQF